MSNRPNYPSWLDKEHWTLLEAVLLVEGRDPHTTDAKYRVKGTRVFCYGLDRETYESAEGAARLGKLPTYGREGPRLNSHFRVKPVEFIQWADAEGIELPVELRDLDKGPEPEPSVVSDGDGPPSWDALHVVVQDGRVEMRWDDRRRLVSLLELGMEQKRNSYPTVAWAVLHKLAELDGECPPETLFADARPTVVGSVVKRLTKDHIRQVNRALRGWARQVGWSRLQQTQPVVWDTKLRTWNTSFKIKLAF